MCNNRSFIVTGSMDQMAILLADTVGEQFASFRFSHECWEQFLMGIRHDPCRNLFHRLFEATGSANEVRISHFRLGMAVFITACHSTLSFEFLAESRMRVEIAFGEEELGLVTPLSEEINRRLVRPMVTSGASALAVVPVTQSQQAAFIVQASERGLCFADDFEGAGNTGIVAKTERGFRFLMDWLKGQAIINVN